jgi:hypothetical protein
MVVAGLGRSEREFSVLAHLEAKLGVRTAAQAVARALRESA